ncbi:hypothetical protein Pelo_9488 [Pelomyxa schiedti]|nr:hypothetical protein Pelo_9486 [Pelomyxa schiedti]KAH3758704.1 hypothetical protein Pelo_9488 [Pelomyxa schiedti]
MLPATGNFCNPDPQSTLFSEVTGLSSHHKPLVINCLHGGIPLLESVPQQQRDRGHIFPSDQVVHPEMWHEPPRFANPFGVDDISAASVPQRIRHDRRLVGDSHTKWRHSKRHNPLAPLGSAGTVNNASYNNKPAASVHYHFPHHPDCYTCTATTMFN